MLFIKKLEMQTSTKKRTEREKKMGWKLSPLEYLYPMILHAETSLKLPSLSINVLAVFLQSKGSSWINKGGVSQQNQRSKDPLIAMHVSKAIFTPVSCEKLYKYFRIKRKTKKSLFYLPGNKEMLIHNCNGIYKVLSRSVSSLHKVAQILTAQRKSLCFPVIKK